MMKYTLFVAFLLIAACTEPAMTPEEKVSRALCECIGTSNLVALNAEAQKTLSENNSDPKLQTLFAQISEEYQKTSSCLQPAIQAYRKNGKREQSLIEEQLKKLCPQNQELAIQVVNDLILNQ